MTATNLIASTKHGRIWIMTDGASYLDDGTIAEFKSKVRAIPEWPAVISGRGNSFGIDTASRELLCRASTFEELVGIATRELPQIVETFRLDRPFELIFSGFLRGRPLISYIRTSNAVNGMDAPPFLLLPMDSTMFGPWPGDAAERIAPGPEDEPETIKAGLNELIKLQRRVPADDGFSRVGGFAELTTITTAGIEQEIIHRWPEDRVGQRMSVEG